MHTKSNEFYRLVEKSSLPLVSAIIPAYNGEKLIEDEIKSLANQNYKNIEIIVAENKSTDNSVKVLNSLVADGYPIKIILNDKNLGYTGGSNQGIKISKGKYLLLLSQDRVFEPEWLEKTVFKMETDPKVGCVVGKVIGKENNLPDFGYSIDKYGAVIMKRSPETDNLFFSGGAILVRKSVLDKIGPFDDEFFMYQEDVDLCWRIQLAGYSISLVESAVSYNNGRLINIFVKNGKIQSYLDSNITHLPDYIFYHSIARNRIRVLLKNYSKSNIIKRLPVAIVLIFLRGIYHSLITKKSFYFFSVFKGLWWNITHFRNTMKYRKKIQKMRVIKDDIIEKHMIKKSIEIAVLSKNFFHS